MTHLQAVLFDLDGTFADTAPDLVNALNQTLVNRGHQALPYEQVKPYVSKGAPGMIKIAFDLSPGDANYDSVRQEFLDIYLNHICDHTQLFSGIEETLEYLEQNNIHWGIITNKPEFLTKPLMEKLQLNNRAAVIYSGDTFKEKKPHPLPLLKAAETLQVKADNCIYVGDDQRDMLAARAASMYAIAATWGYIPEEEDPAQWDADCWLDNSTHLKQTIINACG